jgi:hypothetical protein
MRDDLVATDGHAWRGDLRKDSSGDEALRCACARAELALGCAVLTIAVRVRASTFHARRRIFRCFKGLVAGPRFAWQAV